MLKNGWKNAEKGLKKEKLNDVTFLDANVIINAFKPQHNHIMNLLIKTDNLACSEMVRLEVIGFPDIDLEDEKDLEDFFKNLTVFPIDRSIIDSAIKIRQQKSIDSPDAIIAATAIRHKQKLWTSNIKDFGWIKNLDWHDPLSGESST